jgi:hypothetical protein
MKAPTALAASNIGGRTIESNGVLMDEMPTTQRLQDVLGVVDLLIVDEISNAERIGAPQVLSTRKEGDKKAVWRRGCHSGR